MSFKVTITDGVTGEVVHDESHLEAEVLVVMVRRGKDGKTVVDYFDPYPLDDHTDTLRLHGGRIVDFAKQ